MTRQFLTVSRHLYSGIVAFKQSFSEFTPALNIYGGTVPRREIERRREANKAARAARRANHGR